MQFRQAKPRPQPPSATQRVEAHLLNGLLQNPDVYYRVNGKLREVAGEDEQLRAELLTPLGGMDFAHEQYRALMELFLQSLAQDEQDVAEYMENHATDDLADDLDAVRHNQMEAPLKDPSRVSKRDLEHVMKRIQRAGLVVDEQQDCIAQAYGCAAAG